MKLWLDDERQAPVGWEWVKTADDCIRELQTGRVSELSLDHDLAEMHYAGDFSKEKTGYDVVLFLEENQHLVPTKINLHTLNPAGRDRMRRVCERLDAQLSLVSALQINKREP